MFTTPTENFVVYEIEEKGFYRIDFVRPPGVFNTDINAIVYSLVRKKQVYTYGVSDIYNQWLKVKESVQAAKMKMQKESKWKDGVYVTTIIRVNEKLGYKSMTETWNGVTHSYALFGDGYSIGMEVSDSIYGMKLEPLHFSMYQSAALSSDTIASESGGLFYSIDVLKRRHDISHLDEYDFVVATDVETARKRLKEFQANKCPFRGFDTETTGTEVHMFGKDHMVGIILGHDMRTSTYFPFRHTGDFNLPMDFLPELMKYTLRFQDKMVGHNVKFDRQVMLKEGYDLRIKYDTLPISIILNPILGKGIHGEKQLMYELDGRHYLELDEIFINSKDINFAVLPVEIIHYYACPDGNNPIRLLQSFFKKLPKFQYKLADLECDLTSVKADQEYYGIRVDTKKFERQYRNCNYVIDMLLNAFRTLTHVDGNINSPQVLQDLIYNKMHCKVLLRTNTGQASTSMNAIKKLAKVKAKNPNPITEDLVDMFGKTVIKAKELADSAYPALVILSKYREYNKLKTAFYSRFETTMKTGRIFFWVNQNGAATGRQSSPMHQLPPEIKDCILSDTENHDFWGPDYSQVELRMIAYLAGERELIDLASDPDNDIHRVIGSLISGKPMWAITPEERSIGKRRNFGVVYLISKYGLAGQLKGPGYTKEDVLFAEQQLNDFFKRFKRINRYIQYNAKKVKKKGYMETAWFHRRRLFNEVFDKDIEPSKLASILRMGNNVPVQGTAADLLKLAEVQYDAYIRNKGWNKIVDGFPLVRIMLSIHDEVIISAHQSIPYEEIVEMIVSCMEISVEGAPPFFVQPARMDNWGEHSNDAVAMPIPFRDKIIEDYRKTGKSIFKQSWFKLILPEEAIQEVSSTAYNIDTFINKYQNSSHLKFVRGDYITNVDAEDIKIALSAFVESGSTQYRKDNYLDLLNEYRHEQLYSYITDLISKYGTDYREVGLHVRHPSLTFQLLDLYDKKISYDLSHEERITEATHMYLDEYIFGTAKKVVLTNLIEKKEIKVTDKDVFTQQLEPLVNFDQFGNVVYEDLSDEIEDPYNYFYDEGADDIIDICNNKPVYVWELADTIVFDCQSIRTDSVNRVLSYIFQHKQDDGFYKAMLIYNDQLLDTHMSIENLDIDEASNFVQSLVEKEVMLDLV